MPTKLQRVIEALMETVIRTLIGTLLRNPYKDSLRIPVRVWGCGIRVGVRVLGSGFVRV